MPDEDEYLPEDFLSADQLLRGFNEIIDEFALLTEEDFPDA